ncbi:MAG TPA: carboxypeptidase regulatory-like domain-containing protein [Terriglobales bacterium]|nr:carboxypeptidase regulatory-like domain-containing protein [Terriglobales bacterium]
MRFRILMLVLLLGALSILCSAQETTATITGVVKDASGAVLPNVDVVIRNTGTGQERAVTTSQEGEYTATSLPIGTYEVSVKRAGFKDFLVKNIILNVNDRRRIEATLQVGGSSEQVTVEAAELAVQTENSQVGSVVTGRTVQEMPLNGRSLFSLVALQPGVSAASGIVSGRVGVGLDNLASVNVNGMRAAQNNWLIDGADNVDTGSNLGLLNYISIDSVAEFRILRGNYSAEFGQRGGGQINVVTKSGTNNLHGGAFYFGRNDALDAVNAFSTLDLNKDGKVDPAPIRYHNFGYNIGGPVVKNKLFFFWNHEFRRVKQVRLQGVQNAVVPTALERQGIFSSAIVDPLTCTGSSSSTCTPFANNTIPTNRIDPNALAYLSIIPMPNASIPNSSINFQSATPQSRNYREELVRIDYNLSDRHKIFGRWMKDTIPSTEPFGEVFGSNQTNIPFIAETETNIPAQNLVLEWNWLPSNTMVNTLAFNMSRGGIQSKFIGTGLRSVAPNIAEYFDQVPAKVLPSISFGGIYSNYGYYADPPYDNTYGSYRIKDTVAWVKGKHSFKFGYLFSHEYKNENNASGINGTFTFPGTSSNDYFSTGNSFADFLLGRASAYSENDIDFASKLRYQMHEAFAQDDFKVLPNLTLNLGVRWSAILPPYDLDNRLTNFLPEMFDPARAYTIRLTAQTPYAAGTRVQGTGDPLNGIIIAGQNSPWGKYVSKPQWKTVAPRFGFAWDPWSNGKTAVRGGYGMFFDRTLSGTFLQNAFVNPPFVNTVTALSSGGVNSPTFTNPGGGISRDPEALVPTLIATSGDFKIPTTHQWNLTVQHELPGQVIMEVAYVGNHASHLLRELRINQTPAGTASPAAAYTKYRGYGNIRVRDTSSSSSYNALQVGVNKRAARGLTVGMAYTWSKVITDSPSDRSDFQQDINNLAAERGLADFDKTHIFASNFLYELPFFNNSSKTLKNVLGGWQFGGIFRAESGRAQTVTASNSSANSSFGGSLRPNQVSDPNNGPKTRAKWFDTSAFQWPGMNQFGNARRGVFRGPGLWLADLTFYKNFTVTEQVRLQFRADLFNAFNHVNFNTVGTTATFNQTTGAQTNADFGRVTNALEPRQIQYGLRLTF